MKKSYQKLCKEYETDDYYSLIDYWYLCNHFDQTIIDAVKDMNKTALKDYMQYCNQTGRTEILGIILRNS